MSTDHGAGRAVTRYAAMAIQISTIFRSEDQLEKIHIGNNENKTQSAKTKSAFHPFSDFGKGMFHN